MRPSTASSSSPNILDKFKSPEIARILIKRIAAYRAPVTMMEVCGTHTAALLRTGVRQSLPGNLRLISGPGCPVCVTPRQMVEAAIQIALRKDTVLFCFGDMLRVPGISGSLESAGSTKGARVKVMYSPSEGIAHAIREPHCAVVLFGIGFETTIPIFASTMVRAREENIRNLFLLPAFRLVPPALHALLAGGDTRIDGFLLPGHVSSIIGEAAYDFIASRYRVPGVIAGFEAVDMLEGIFMLLEMIATRQPSIRNQYSRFVPRGGNPRALAIMHQVFEPCDAEWRGLGTLKDSGLRFRDEFAGFDASALIDLPHAAVPEPGGCICGEVIKGRRTPDECVLYGKDCTPSHPVGPCMVSSEGTCAAYYTCGAHHDG